MAPCCLGVSPTWPLVSVRKSHLTDGETSHDERTGARRSSEPSSSRTSAPDKRSSRPKCNEELRMSQGKPTSRPEFTHNVCK